MLDVGLEDQDSNRFCSDIRFYSSYDIPQNVTVFVILFICICILLFVTLKAQELLLHELCESVCVCVKSKLAEFYFCAMEKYH